MKPYPGDRIRNLALAGHGGSGKTTLAEAFHWATTGSLRPNGGLGILDSDPEAAKRGFTVTSNLLPLEWRNHKINLIDTPGYLDFAAEVRGALRVVDGVLLTYCATAGVEVGSERAWEYAEEESLPKVVFVNKCDRENADFKGVLSQLRSRYGSGVVPVTVPVSSGPAFHGVVNLLDESMAPSMESAREALIEAIAATDDELTAQFLENEPIAIDKLVKTLQLATRQRKLIPVFCGSAITGAGVVPMLDMLLQLLPPPVGEPASDAIQPIRALVFKTLADAYVGRLSLLRVYSGRIRSDTQLYNATKGRDERIGQLYLLRGKEQLPVPEVQAGDIAAVTKLQETTTGDTLTTKTHPVLLQPARYPTPMLSLAVLPKAKADEEKIGVALSRLIEEDPTLRVDKSPHTNQMLVTGMGELHLEVLISRLQRKFGVEVDLQPPAVPYRQTIRGRAKAEGKHKKQTGGRGQYGHVWLEIEPLPPGRTFEFVDNIFGGAVPRQYIPAVEKGLRELVQDGILPGIPVVDVRVTLLDGSYHAVDSSEMAFKIAAGMAFKAAFAQANPVLLEPILAVEVAVPDTYTGEIIAHLNKKRAKILGMEPEGNGLQLVRAQAPQAEMFRYAVDLRSISQGRGHFHAEFDRYEEIPATLAESIIQKVNTTKAS